MAVLNSFIGIFSHVPIFDGLHSHICICRCWASCQKDHQRTRRGQILRMSMIMDKHSNSWQSTSRVRKTTRVLPQAGVIFRRVRTSLPMPSARLEHALQAKRAY